MGKVDLVIKGGKIVSSDGTLAAGLAVQNGRIVAISQETHLPPARQVIEADGLLILPGLIDPHVHMRDPGHTEREDWTTGTMAAAMGGITTILEHPNSVPPANSAKNFRYKVENAKSKAIVDFGLYGGAGETNLKEIPAIAMAGAVAFKTFLYPYHERADEFEGIFATDNGAILDIFAAVAKTGLMECIHSENYQIVVNATRKLKDQGRISSADYALSHPLLAEMDATAQAIRFARETGVRLHVVHVSAGSTAHLIGEAKTRGDVKVTGETCPHYLLLNEEQATKLGPYGVINPPLRSEHERELLWSSLLAGDIEMLGSDHAPHLAEAKELGWKNIFDSPAGAPNMELLLSLMLTQVSQGKLDLPTLVKLTSENVAKSYGIYPRKGVIQVGSDADVALIDPSLRRIIDRSQMATKAREIARMYEGWELVGVPVMTIVRGQVVMQDGKITAEPGTGRWIPGQAFDPAQS
jgi:allantoinase